MCEAEKEQNFIKERRNLDTDSTDKPNHKPTNWKRLSQRETKIVFGGIYGEKTAKSFCKPNCTVATQQKKA